MSKSTHCIILKLSLLVCGLQAAVALGVQSDFSRSMMQVISQNSFLARVSLLDPRTVADDIAEAIAEHIALAGPPPTAMHEAKRHQDYAAIAINYLLRQLCFHDPNANMLANGVRPLSTGSRLSLHSSRVTALQFPMWVRGDDDSVVSSRGKLSLGDAATKRNPFYDSGVVKYYLKAGGASPPTPFSGRKVLAAAVWYV
jgi:hypothetical protein